MVLKRLFPSQKNKSIFYRGPPRLSNNETKQKHTDKPLLLLKSKRNVGRKLLRMRFLRYASKTDRPKLSSFNLHLKMLPKLHFKCNLNVIVLFNYTDMIVCRLNAATRNHWAMNIDLFLFGTIFNTFVLNLGQFSFSFEFLYQSDTVQIILHRFRGYCVRKLVLTMKMVEWYKPKTCQLFISTMELVRHHA